MNTDIVESEDRTCGPGGPGPALGFVILLAAALVAIIYVKLFR